MCLVIKIICSHGYFQIKLKILALSYGFKVSLKFNHYNEYFF